MIDRLQFMKGSAALAAMGALEGCSSLCNRDYPAVSYCRDWIREHTDMKW